MQMNINDEDSTAELPRVVKRRTVRKLKHPLPIVLTGPEYERWQAAKLELGVREDSIAFVRLLDRAGLDRSEATIKAAAATATEVADA